MQEKQAFYIQKTLASCENFKKFKKIKITY